MSQKVFKNETCACCAQDTVCICGLREGGSRGKRDMMEDASRMRMND